MQNTPPWRREVAGIVQLLQEELNRVMGVSTSPETGSNPNSERAGVMTELQPSAWSPVLDLVEGPSQLTLWVDLPGIDPAAIELSVTGQVLLLSGDRHPPTGETGREQVLERPFGPFARKVLLPCMVNTDAISAESRNGVLKVELPKINVAQPRTLPVRQT
jgi:HSP20 family protein